MNKGIVSGIKRMEIHDGDGLRTTVFLKGCPLKCIWCHNPESISYEPEIGRFEEKCISCGSCVRTCDTNAFFIKDGIVLFDKGKCTACMQCEKICPVFAIVGYGKEYSVDSLVEELLTDKPFFGDKGGITFSGGECLTQTDFVVKCAKRLKEKGVGVYIDTCGYVKRDVFEKIMPYVDKFLYDLKAIDGDLHKRLTGRDNAAILDNMKFLSDKKCAIEIRFPLVKGYNDGETEKIGEFIKRLNIGIPVKVLRYHDFARSRYNALQRRDTLPEGQTTAKDVVDAEEILRNMGIIVIKDN